MLFEVPVRSVEGDVTQGRYIAGVDTYDDDRFPLVADREGLMKPTVKYRTLSDLAEELRAALRTAKIIPGR